VSSIVRSKFWASTNSNSSLCSQRNDACCSALITEMYLIACAIACANTHEWMMWARAHYGKGRDWEGPGQRNCQPNLVTAWLKSDASICACRIYHHGVCLSPMP